MLGRMILCGLVTFCVVFSAVQFVDAAVVRIDTVNTNNNIASDVHFYQQSGATQWTDSWRSEVYTALQLFGSTVYTLTPKQFNFWWATTLEGTQPTTIVPKLAYPFNGDNFDYFYCNNPTAHVGSLPICYPGLTAGYMSNANDVDYHFIGYDIYLASSPGLNSSFYSLTPMAGKYYFRDAIVEALFWAAGLGGTLPTTAVGNSGIAQRFSSANCPLCISKYDSALQYANGTYVFNSWSRPLTSAALAVLYSGITSTSLVVSYTPKADEPDTTTTVYTQPGLYYPGWSLYTWTTSPLRATGVGPNPGSYPFLSSTATAPIGLVGNTLTTSAINQLETYLLRTNGLYSYVCGTSVTCGTCNAIAGCGWCEKSSFCVDVLAAQACPDPTEQPIPDATCNVCTASSDCNPVDVHPSCFTATCVQNVCNVSLVTAGTSCIVGGNACNLGQCSVTGQCVVSGLCDDGLTCTVDTCGAGPACTHTPIVPSTDCGVCAVAGDCLAPAFAGCVNITCDSGHCAYAPLTGTACDPGNSCFSNGTCSATGTCVSPDSYLINGTAFGCPAVPNTCFETHCVGTSPSPVCTVIPIPAPSACYTCNNATGAFTQNTCSSPPAGEAAICTVTAGAPACSDVPLGCSADADCDAICGTATLCNANTCDLGTCVCNQPLVCPNQCYACSIFTNECALLNGYDLNECGTCAAGEPCCDHGDCSGAHLVNALAPVNKRDVEFVHADDDDDSQPANQVIENGVQIVCQAGVPNICQYTFVVYTAGAEDVIISNPALNFITFDGQLQTTRTPPQTITERSDEQRGTIYRLTTFCSTNVTWSLFAFGHWLNISSGSAGRQLVDDCGVCNGDNVCSYCNNNGDQCIACGCSAPLLTCRAQDALACAITSPCTYPTCNTTLDIGDMCIDNLVPAGTPCEKRGHTGTCTAEGTCIFDESWSSSSLSSSYPYYYSSIEEPLNNSHSTQAGMMLLPLAVAILLGLVIIILVIGNEYAVVTLAMPIGGGEYDIVTFYPNQRGGYEALPTHGGDSSMHHKKPHVTAFGHAQKQSNW